MLLKSILVGSAVNALKLTLRPSGANRVSRFMNTTFSEFGRLKTVCFSVSNILTIITPDNFISAFRRDNRN